MVYFRSIVLKISILLSIGLYASANDSYASSANSTDGKHTSIRMTTPRAWALATTAILFERNNARHDLLGGCLRTQENVTEMKQVLSQWWGINNREELLNSLNWIKYGGHREGFEKLGAYMASLDKQQLAELSAKVRFDEDARNQVDIVRKYYGKFGRKSLLGWDYARYVALCRWGYLVGYLSEKEAWDRIMPVASMLQRAFNSWKDLGENYLVGRQFWSYGQTQRDGQLYLDAYRKLLNNSSSPWKHNAWKMSLDSGNQ